ncbi:hypothetical protein BJY52DRAFT_1280986, partial [Lactarius psammicola]
EGLPPLPLLPASSHTSPRDRLSPISPVSVPSRRTSSPTSSIHSRSLPPPKPPLSIMPSYSSPASPDPGPASSTPSHPTPPCSRSYTHLRTPARVPVEHVGVGRSLSIRTTNFSHGFGALSARSASIRVAPSRSGLSSGDWDPFDLPSAYTRISHSSSARSRREDGFEI